jgi:hypothetical protein
VLSLVELKENPEKMKKIMIAALGLSLLSGTAVFAQNTSTDAGTMKGKKSKHKKAKKTKGTASDTAASK